MFIILGLGFAWQASSYQMGTAARMGPGIFLSGSASCWRCWAPWCCSARCPKAEETHVDKFDWRIVFLVVGSVVVYGLVLKLLGVYISVFILVLISSLASHEFSLKVAVANGIFLVVFTYLAFIKGLGLIFPLWPSFLGMN